MRHAHYSTQAPHATDWASMLRILVVVTALAVLGWWLVTGPAGDWLSSATDWLRGI
jgi:hypothetical protein